MKKMYTLIKNAQKSSRLYYFTLFWAWGTKFMKKNTMEFSFYLFSKYLNVKKNLSYPFIGLVKYKQCRTRQS